MRKNKITKICVYITMVLVVFIIGIDLHKEKDKDTNQDIYYEYYEWDASDTMQIVKNAFKSLILGDIKKEDENIDQYSFLEYKTKNDLGGMFFIVKSKFTDSTYYFLYADSSLTVSRLIKY